MHIVLFGDQHVESLGGAQVSMRLQRRFLERAGHTVTIVAPRMHGPRGRAIPPDAAYVDTPSIPITVDREYSMSWPGRRTDRFVDRALATRPPVDVVHVQADFWGAFIGHRFAQRHGLPVVHTFHNRVDVGLRAVAPRAAGVALRVLNAWQRRALRRVPGEVGHDGWAYLRRFARRSDAVTAPSAHFAHKLEAQGAVARRAATPSGVPGVDVVWNGIDDAELDAALAAETPRRAGPPRFVWVGRMSPEKRLLPFLRAVAESGVDAEIEVIGGGGEERAARRLVERSRPRARVTFSGRMPHAQTLGRLADSDAVVQTSIGFETQGMTVFEAASLGTPSVVCDPDIATELTLEGTSGGVWTVADASTAALADTLRTAAADIADGTAPVPSPEVAARFRQSSRTAAMVEIYRRVTATR